MMTCLIINTTCLILMRLSLLLCMPDVCTLITMSKTDFYSTLVIATLKTIIALGVAHGSEVQFSLSPANEGAKVRLLWLKIYTQA